MYVFRSLDLSHSFRVEDSTFHFFLLGKFTEFGYQFLGASGNPDGHDRCAAVAVLTGRHIIRQHLPEHDNHHRLVGAVDATHVQWCHRLTNK